MSRNRLFIPLLAAALGTTAVALWYGNQTSPLTAGDNHDSNCVWNHYEEIKPTYENNGCREYWVCCSHSGLGPVFTKPGLGTINEANHTANFANTIHSDDPRFIDAYKNPISFEDGVLPSFVNPKKLIKTVDVVDNGIDGAKSMRIRITGSDFGVDFTKYYLDQVFSDPEVVAINFEAKGDAITSNWRHRTNGANVCYEFNLNGYGLTTEWKTFTFTREYYNSHLDSSDCVIYGGALSGEHDIFIDNIRPVKESLTSYGFENGRLNDNLEGVTYYRFDPTINEAIFSAPAGKGIITKVGFDYSKKTEGNRSFYITKNDGYVSFFFNSRIYSSLGDNDAVEIDIYSTVGANGQTASNFIDGLNGKTLGSLPANRWETLRFTKHQMSSSDGRFLIIQGSTAGTLYFDNIRFTHLENMGETLKELGERAVEDPSGTTTFATDQSIDTISNITIDGAKVTTSKISFSSGGVTIPNSYLSVGDHVLIITYIHEGRLYTERITFRIINAVFKPEVNVTVAYMSDAYYTLSGIDNIYRITCDDKEVPFEEKTSSSVLIPEGALAQLCADQSGNINSKAITLKIYTLDQLYIQTMNITVTGASSPKAIPSYSGKGIWTHAYSSTNSQANNTNYTQYYNEEKVEEFAETGIQVMYEQAGSVSPSETTMPAKYRYLLDNAAKYGRKVMLIDSALGTMSRQTHSLIGYNTTLANGQVVNFASKSALDTYVEGRLKIYLNEPNVYGISIGDEQTYAMLCGGFGDVMQSIHRVLDKLGRNDFFVNCNMNPLNATFETLAGPNQTGVPEADWTTYIEKYLEVSGNNYIQYDIYPLTDETKTISGAKYTDGVLTTPGYGLSNFGLRNLVLAAKLASEHNVELHVVTQSLTYDNTRILNNSDVYFLNNTLMGFGVKHISWFVYCCRAYTGSEVWVEDGSMLRVDGSKTPLYYYIGAMAHQINTFGPFVSAFDYKWCRLYKGSNASDAWFYNGVCNNSAFKSYYPSATTYGEVSSYSVDKSWGIITGLQEAGGKNMFMIQNLHNDFGASIVQSHKITLNNNNYNYAVVFENGLPRVVKLGDNGASLSFLKRKTLSLTLSSGHAAFVLLY